MLKSAVAAVLSALVLCGCAAPSARPTSALESGPAHPLVRPALVPFETDEPLGVATPILVPLQPSASLPTGKDPLADAGTHLRIRMTVKAGQETTIDSVTVGAGTARAYLTDSQDLVVALLGKGGKRLSSAGVRQPLVEYVHAGQNGKSERDRALPTSPHGKRTLGSAQITVFLPAIEGAERVEVRFGGEKGRVAAEYLLP